MSANTEFKVLFDWFNSLDSNTQINILEYLHDKTDELYISDEDRLFLNDLVNGIKSLIIDYEDDEEIVITNLIENGLDKIFAKGFYSFCKELAAPHLDAKIVKKMSKANIDKLCSFVLNHMILYKDYEDTPFEDFMRLIGQKYEEPARRAIRFTRSHYKDVGNRKYSLETLANKLTNVFKFPKEKVNAIITPLKENLAEIHQAILLNQVNNLILQISSLSCNSVEDEERTTL
jgi:hypothetical protein